MAGNPQHPDEDGPEPSILLAIDQQLGESAALRVGPELADAVGSLEVGEQEDMEQLGPSSLRQGVQPLLQLLFELVGAHEGSLTAGGVNVALLACPRVDGSGGRKVGDGWWDGADDDQLVEESGLAGVRAVSGGLAQPDPRGFQAQAELTRRLTVELRGTRSELKASGSRIERLTWALVGLTGVLVVLTVVLLFRPD